MYHPLPWEPAPTEAQQAAERLKMIPAIEPSVVQELLTRITPLLRVHGRLCAYQPAVPQDPFATSFTWDVKNAGGPIDPQGLPLLEAVTTYHACGYHSVFKPTIAEVLAQIPPHLLPHVVAFEVLFGQQVTECVDYPGLYGHKTVALLYGLP